jgi:hypothetical protein
MCVLLDEMSNQGPYVLNVWFRAPKSGLGPATTTKLNLGINPACLHVRLCLMYQIYKT